jgi:ribosomal protein L17
MAERLISLAIDGSLAARQRAEAILQDRAIIPKDHREDYDQMSDAKRDKVRRARSGRRHRLGTPKPGIKFTAMGVIHKLFDEIGPAMKRRNEKLGSAGGYTRVIKLSERRLGDGGQLAILQLVSEKDEARSQNTSKTERKRKARVKYTVYAGKPRPHGRRRGGGEKVKAEAAPAKAKKAPAKKTAAEEPAAEAPAEPGAEAPEEKKDE